ncbi:MAG: DUF4422 domain-containing protein [bacterium]
MKKIKIFASYHKDAYRVKNEVFEPIQIGRDVFPVLLDDMIGDNTGDNISKRQPFYSDYVTPYWLLKNYIDTCEEDYIGVCHYRRIFSFKRPFSLRYIKAKIGCQLGKYIKRYRSCWDWNAHYIYKEEDFQRYIDEFTIDIQRDIQQGKHLVYGYKPITMQNLTIKDLNEKPISKWLFILFEKILFDKYPDIAGTFKELCKSNSYNYSSCYIMQKDLYKKYITILFDLLFEFEKQVVEQGYIKDPCSEKIVYRGAGFLGEMMISTFIQHQLKIDKSSVKLLNGVLYNVL